MSMLLQATEAVAETTEQTMGLGELFLAGGWLMWPLLLLGGVTIFIFCERFWAIKQASRMVKSQLPYSFAVQPIPRSLT